MTGGKAHKEKLFKEMEEHFLKMSNHSFGCRVVQKVVEVFSNNETCITTILKEI